MNPTHTRHQVENATATSAPSAGGAQDAGGEGQAGIAATFSNNPRDRKPKGQGPVKSY
ncbi:MAG: hypothetical protein ACOX52_08250 [Verrucomicrobiota bacterium]